MLFSREDVSAFINQHFEPVWEMVRPVPIVRIDFGNGNVATRTMRGNVASYVCSADGQIVDILPGIYTPAAYTTALARPRDLTGALSRLDSVARLASLRGYHRDSAQLVRQAMQPRPPANREADRGKIVIEVLVANVTMRSDDFGRAIATAAPRPRNAAELASWLPLAEDTRINETERRLLIHDRLATADALRPEQIMRWLYREVLHADLDDPNLGLGDDFFADLER